MRLNETQKVKAVSHERRVRQCWHVPKLQIQSHVQSDPSLIRFVSSMTHAQSNRYPWGYLCSGIGRHTWYFSVPPALGLQGGATMLGLVLSHRDSEIKLRSSCLQCEIPIKRWPQPLMLFPWLSCFIEFLSLVLSNENKTKIKTGLSGSWVIWVSFCSLLTGHNKQFLKVSKVSTSLFHLCLPVSTWVDIFCSVLGHTYWRASQICFHWGSLELFLCSIHEGL